jgi:hypothetical protein
MTFLVLQTNNQWSTQGKPPTHLVTQKKGNRPTDGQPVTNILNGYPCADWTWNNFREQYRRVKNAPGVVQQSIQEPYDIEILTVHVCPCNTVLRRFFIPCRVHIRAAVTSHQVSDDPACRLEHILPQEDTDFPSDRD